MGLLMFDFQTSTHVFVAFLFRIEDVEAGTERLGNVFLHRFGHICCGRESAAQGTSFAQNTLQTLLAVEGCENGRSQAIHLIDGHGRECRRRLDRTTLASVFNAIVFYRISIAIRSLRRRLVLFRFLVVFFTCCSSRFSTTYSTA